MGLTQRAGGYGGREAGDYQINEIAFKDFLKKRTWGREGSHAADRDVQSLSLIVRLRNGKQVRDVAKSKFLFVTHNVKLTFLARDFLRDEGQLEDGSVWPFLSVGQISTISWVASESFDDEKRVSKELIANCYSAALPDQDFDERLKEALIQANPQTAHDIFQNAFVTHSVRQAALSQTMGYSALLSKLNTSDLLAQAAVAREEAISHAKAEERKVVSTELAESLKSRQINIAKSIAKIAATIIVKFAVLICGAAMLRDLDVFGQTGEHRGFILISILAVAGIYGLLDLSGLLPAASTRAALKNTIFKIIRYIQLRLT